MALDPITGAEDMISTIVSTFFGNKSATEQARITLALQENAGLVDILKGQIGTNTAEASNPNLFVSGWRPFLGWILSGSVGLYIVLTIIVNFTHAFGVPTVAIPPLDPAVKEILMGMLGLNIIARSYDKKNGVASQ